MANIPTSTVEQFNSTTYVDLLGIELGLSRLPAESAPDYLRRLSVAASHRRDHPYPGALVEMSVSLGLKIQPYIRVESPSGLISVDLLGVHYNGHTSPLLFMDIDNQWTWRKLSDIITDMNTWAGVTATLLVKDGPALQLASQSNHCWVSDVISTNPHKFSRSPVLLDTVSFSQSVITDTINEQEVSFVGDPPVGAKVYYNFVPIPFEMVGSEVGLFGLKDAGFASAAAPDGSVLAHQVQEVLQDLMGRDRSYWAR